MFIQRIIPGELKGTFLEYLEGFLPVDLRPIDENYSPRKLYSLVLRNVEKRIELDDDEDVMGRDLFIWTVNGLLLLYTFPNPQPSTPQPGMFDHSYQPGTLFNEQNLDWFLRYGLLRPRYFLKNYDKNIGNLRMPEESDRRYPREDSILPAPKMMFDEEGHLLELQIAIPKGTRWTTRKSPLVGNRKRLTFKPEPRQANCHPLAWYEKKGWLLKDFDATTFLDKRLERGWLEPARPGILLFTFKQAWQVQKMFQCLYARINWLHYSPEKYQRYRKNPLQELKNFLTTEKLPPLAFCQKVKCQAILPVIRRKDYCGDSCRKPAKYKARKTPPPLKREIPPF
jgi:hypothetical protein